MRTPGPWTLIAVQGGFFIHADSGDGSRIPQREVAFVKGNSMMAESNARAIAAIPDLVQGLRVELAWWEEEAVHAKGVAVHRANIRINAIKFTLAKARLL